ncbi:hypothetical protein [Mergibacter septicus]|nr:hypothetical protein [Mergibacter septicus]UTU48345.1 hypothetical protein HLL31_05960 [Mergibacter septicus]
MYLIRRVMVMVTLLIVSLIPLSSNAENIEKYQNAKIAVNYQGSVGQLAQDMAYRLGIGYYTSKVDPNVKVKVAQNSSKSIQFLLDTVNAQLQESSLQFILLNDQVTLALKQKGSDNYIGPITFEESNAEQTNDVISTQQIAVEDQASAEKKMKEIIALSQDQKLLDKYAQRKQPVYRISDAKAVNLEQVRTTKISTFLIFAKDVDVNKYKIEGKFQEMTKLNNVVAILHTKQQPTDKITIIAPNGTKQELIKVP